MFKDYLASYKEIITEGSPNNGIYFDGAVSEENYFSQNVKPMFLLNEKYGNKPDIFIQKRFTSELRFLEASTYNNRMMFINSIAIHHKQYIDKNYFYGNRCAVWFISYLLGITRCNPLPAHYYCHHCKRITWIKAEYGIELPSKLCVCGHKMYGDGFNFDFSQLLIKPPEFVMLFTHQMPESKFQWSALSFKEQLDVFATYHNSYNNRLKRLSFEECIIESKHTPFHFLYLDDIEEHLIRKGFSKNRAVSVAKYISLCILRENDKNEAKIWLKNIVTEHFTSEQIEELENIRYIYPKAHAVEFLLSLNRTNEKKT